MIDYLPTAEPIWPWWAVAIAAALLVLLTLWTYRAAVVHRRWLLVGLRLAALAVACIVIVRPAWELQEIEKRPVSLVVLLDQSKSMLVEDEKPSRSRWRAMKEDWAAAREVLQEWADKNIVLAGIHTFDEQLSPEMRPGEVELGTEPTGAGTALLSGVSAALERPGGDLHPLQGVIVISDGRDNDPKAEPSELLSQISSLGHPIHTIGIGYPGGSESQLDVIAQSIHVPQTAPVKDRLIARGLIQAQRVVGQEIEVHLLINGEPVKQADNPTKDVFIRVAPTKPLETIPIEFPASKLPGQPGEIRVSLRAAPVLGELTDKNNEVSTYMTLTKEGLSVLYIEGKPRLETKFLKRALNQDERISLYTAMLNPTAGDIGAARQSLRQDLESTNYDVFILGDVPASAFDVDLLDKFENAVAARGAGLIMIGGYESFRDGGWTDTTVGRMLPVQMTESGHLEGLDGLREFQFTPTEDGLRHFALRLTGNVEENREKWSRLAPVQGGNRIGRRKQGAAVLAESKDGDPLLTVQSYGAGRTAAQAVDTTYSWIRPDPPERRRQRTDPTDLPEGPEAHVRYWRQLILWLAQQEDVGKTVRIELDHRRLRAGSAQGITVTARELTPGGSQDQKSTIANAEFNVTVTTPEGKEITVAPAPLAADGAARGTLEDTSEEGEYEVIVSATQDGAELGTARARFMTYRDDTETTNRSANHALLEELARSTGGQYRLHGGLRNLLDELKLEAAGQTIKTLKLPNWSRPNAGLHGLMFLLFVSLIIAEWVLRRLWGLV